MRDKIIDAGVKQLREFGYLGVTVDNILTDKVYRTFFRKQLEGTIDAAPSGPAAAECAKLLKEIPTEL
jgi:hypothetical protein